MEEPSVAAESMTNDESMDNSYQLDFEMSTSKIEFAGNDSPRNRVRPRSTLAHNSTSQLETGFASSPRWRNTSSIKNGHDSLPQIGAGTSSSGSLLRSNFKAQTKGSSTVPWQLPQSKSNETPEWLKKLKNKGEKDGTDGAKPSVPYNDSTAQLTPTTVRKCKPSTTCGSADEECALPEWKRKFLEMKLSGRVLAESEVADDPNFVTSNVDPVAGIDSGVSTPLWKRKFLQDKTACDAAHFHETDDAQAVTSRESQEGECSSIPDWKLSIWKSRQMQAELLSLEKQANDDRTTHPGENSVPSSILSRLHAENIENNSSACISPRRRGDNTPEWMKKFQSMNFEKEETVIEAGGKQDPSVMTNGNGVVVSWMRTTTTTRSTVVESTERRTAPTEGGEKCLLQRAGKEATIETRESNLQSDVPGVREPAHPALAGISRGPAAPQTCTSEPPFVEVTSSGRSREAECSVVASVQPNLEPCGVSKKKKKKKVRDEEVLESTITPSGAASFLIDSSQIEAENAMNESFAVHDLVPEQGHQRKSSKGKKGLQQKVDSYILEPAEVQPVPAIKHEEGSLRYDEKGAFHESHSSQDTDDAPATGSGERRKKKKKKARENFEAVEPTEGDCALEHRQHVQDQSCVVEPRGKRCDTVGDSESPEAMNTLMMEQQDSVDLEAAEHPPADLSSTKPSLHDSISSRDSSQAQSSEAKVRRRKKKKNGVAVSPPDPESIKLAEDQGSTLQVANVKSIYHESFSSGGESLHDEDGLSGEGHSSLQADSSRCGSKSSSTSSSNSSGVSSKDRKQRLEEKEQIVNTLKAFLEQSKSRIAERNLNCQDASLLPNSTGEHKDGDTKPHQKQKSSSNDKRQPPRKSRSRTGNGNRERPPNTSARRVAAQSPPKRSTSTRKAGSRRNSIKNDPPEVNKERDDEDVFRVISRNASFQMSMQKVSLPMDFDDVDEDQVVFSDHESAPESKDADLETAQSGACFSSMMEFEECAEEDMRATKDPFGIHGDIDRGDQLNDFFGFRATEQDSSKDPFGASGAINLDDTEFSEDPFGASGTFGDSFGDGDCPMGFDSVTHVTDSTWDVGGAAHEVKSGRRRSLELSHTSASDGKAKDRRRVERHESGSSSSRRKSMTATSESHKSSRRTTTRTNSSNKERSRKTHRDHEG